MKATTKVGADDYVASGRGSDIPALPRTPAAAAEAVELHALLARTYDELPAIIGGGVQPRGSLCITGGAPKSMKSFTVKQKVLARSLGWRWLGFPTTPGRSLVIQAEIPERELQLRVRTMKGAIAAPIPEGAIHFVTERGLRLDRPDGLRTVRHLIEGLEPDLVVFDPLARFMWGDENSTRDMGRIVAGLDELIQRYGVAIDVVHHTAKPSSDDTREGGQRLRGSSALFAAADSVLLLSRDGADHFKLSFELRHGREPEPMRLRRNEHLWLEPAGPPEELLTVAAVVERLPLRYGQLLDAIQADLDVKKRTAEALVARTRKAGLIAVEDGTYRTTATYRNADAAVVGSPDV